MAVFVVVFLCTSLLLLLQGILFCVDVCVFNNAMGDSHSYSAGYCHSNLTLYFQTKQFLVSATILQRYNNESIMSCILQSCVVPHRLSETTKNRARSTHSCQGAIMKMLENNHAAPHHQSTIPCTPHASTP